MQRSYRYRIYPNKTQRADMDCIVETHRQLYNAALQERRDAWRRNRISISYTSQANQIKEIRTFDDDAAWLNYSSIQQTLRRLDKAFAAFFRRTRAGETPGYPRFKSRRRFRSVTYVYGDGIRLKDGRLHVQNVGEVRIFLHRPIPEGAKIKMMVLKRDKAGNWHATFQIELPDLYTVIRNFPEVGIDMGLEHFAALSNGWLVENPRWFRQAEARLADLQRMRARCRKGSRRYRDLSRRIARLHARVARKRLDFHHKLSARLARDFGFIVVEDLNINGLCRSHVSKSMGDAGWGQFLAMIAYKAEWASSQFAKVSPNGTSQLCSSCGLQVKKSLSVRLHICPHCGFTAPRDVVAAQVILDRGRARTASPRKVVPQLVRAEVVGSFPL